MALTTENRPPLAATGDRAQVLCSHLRELAGEIAPSFNFSQFSVIPSDRRTVTLHLKTEFKAEFKEDLKQMPGPLPPTHEAFSSLASLQEAIDQRLSVVRQEAGSLIDQWVAAEGGDYRHELTAARCMTPRPDLGFQDVCGKCGGKTRVTCTGCSGNRMVMCGGCHGAGRMNCTHCGGTSQIACMGCGGRGTIEKADWEMTVGEAGQTQGQRSITKQVPCGGCGGSGRNACHSCSGGQVPCSGCGASGRINCGTCGATGSVPCDSCAATGKIHHSGRIECTVTRDIHRQAESDNMEDQETLTQRVPFENLESLGKVTLERVQRAAQSMALAYTEPVAVVSAAVSIEGRTFSIRAYGPKPDVFQYQGLADRLLEPDLSELERAIKNPAQLTSAARKFLEADIHAKVAEQPAEGIPASLQNEVAKSLVSKGYLERASAAVGKMVPRLYGAQILKPALGMAAVTAALMMVTMISVHLIFFHRHVIVLSKFRFSEMAAAALMVAWGVIEWRAASALKSALNAPLYERLKGRFAKIRGQIRWVAAVEMFLLAWMYGYLPRLLEPYIFPSLRR